MSPTRAAPDPLTSLRPGWDDALQQWWRQSQTAIGPWKQAWETVMPGVAGQGMASHHHTHGSPSHRGHESCRCQFDECESCGHGCSRCESHDRGNSCHCCVPEADVLVHARAGERRVIPFLLRNHWRREREVSLAVGKWQMRDPVGLEVQAVFDTGQSLTLRPCERRVVRLMVVVNGICDNGKEPDKTPDSTGDEMGAGQFGCDVESCVSAYADVRFEGCARPQRVGVVLHPAICEAVELPCDCGCC